MKRYLLSIFCLLIASLALAQIDPALLRRTAVKSDTLPLNMDAVYNRPFLQIGKLPVALGGYAEANYQYVSENGISEGHQFQMRRVTLFIA
ncbi:MAG TPA: hypothetical protein VFZ47_01210, partial [Chitinophagaceae bacterium]